MPVTLASRAEIVKKMDQQFNDDLKMRQDTTTVGKELLKMVAHLRTNVKATQNRSPKIGHPRSARKNRSRNIVLSRMHLSIDREPIMFQTI